MHGIEAFNAINLKALETGSLTRSIIHYSLGGYIWKGG